MAAQQPRPPWFRFSSLATRAPAPAPPRPPAPAPAPAAVRPSFPIRPPQTQAPAAAPPPPPAPQQRAPPPPPAAAPPPQPPALATVRPRSPVAPAAAPPRPPIGAPAPQPSPLRAPAAAPPTAAPPRSPAQPSPPVAPLPATKSPPTREAVNGKATPPISSPKIIKPLETTQAESPKFKPLSRPPSPLTLPPAQIKSNGEREPMVERKTVLEQQTIDKQVKVPRARNNGIASNGKREPTSTDKATSKKPSDSEEMELRVITLAGENKGAVMELSPSQNKYYAVGNPRIPHKNGDRSSSESGEEGKSRNKEKVLNGGMAMQPPMTSYFNSNVQGLNNSIVANSTLRHKDPGIHLSFRKANGGSSKE